MSFLDKIQDKPYYIRVQILWISVILTMIIIISAWLLYLQSNILSSEGQEKKSVESQKDQIPSLFSSIKNDFFLLKNKLQAGIKGFSGTNEDKGFEVQIIKPNQLPY